MKKITSLGLVLLLASLLILPGCISIAMDTKINPDGSGTRTVDIAIEKSVAQFMEDQTKKSTPKGGKYRSYTKGDDKHYEISYKFKNIKELREMNEEMGTKGSSGTPQSKRIDLKKKDYLFLVDYTFVEEFPSSESSKQTSQLDQAISIRYKVTLPGKITKAKKADEKTETSATWDLTSTKGGKIEVSSRYIRWWTIILAAVIAVGLIILIALIILLKRRAKRTSGTAKVEAEPEKLEPEPEKAEPEPKE